MSLIAFSTGDTDDDLGFLERVKALAFPDLEGSNLGGQNDRFVQNGLIIAQTYVPCLRNNNVNFYDKDDITIGCNVASFTGPEKSRIQAVYAFKPAGQCTRQHYGQKSVGAIMCYVDEFAGCKCSTEADICNQIKTGTQFCAEALGGTEHDFLCSDRIFAKGSSDKIYLAPTFPCDYKIAIHWEGIKRHYEDADLIADDDDLIYLLGLYLKGQQALWLDNNLKLHTEIMRKPERFGDWGGTFWQALSDMAHRCREERRIRKNHACEAIFDDSALADLGMIADPPIDQTGIVFTNVPCGTNQYSKDGTCFDCFTPTVTITISDTTLTPGEAVEIAWNSNVPDIASSVVTLEFGGTVIPLTRNESGSLAFIPTEDTTYTVRAVTACGSVTATASVTVSDTGCECPEWPDCLKVAGFEDIEDCVDGDASESPAWDGELTQVEPCVWGFDFGSYSFKEKNVSVRITLDSCDPDPIYKLQIRYSDGYNQQIVWEGTALNQPYGTFLRTEGLGCGPDSLTVTMCEGEDECEQATIVFDPPANSNVAFPISVFLHASQDDALIYYTLDGSAPTNNGMLYTGAFAMTADETLRAIAYSVDGCIGAVFDADYVAFGNEFSFNFICDDPNDYAGVFDEFAPNSVANDYHWRIRFQNPTDWTLNRIEIYETNSDGVWVSGQAWATANPVYPVEMDGAPFPIYPFVFFKGEVQQNFAYSNDLGVLCSAGLTILDGYGQPFVALTGYFRLLFVFSDGDGEHAVSALIPHECYGYGGYYY